MILLPNGVLVYNAVPFTIKFWTPAWGSDDNAVIEVPSDGVLSASVYEEVIKNEYGVTVVTPRFMPDPAGRELIEKAQAMFADVMGKDDGQYKDAKLAVIVGSIVAAQAYPGEVVGMITQKGYEHVPPYQRRIRPDRFRVYDRK